MENGTMEQAVVESTEVAVYLDRQVVELLLVMLAQTTFPTPDQKMLAASAQVTLLEAQG